jgi:hypothetical protein
VRRRENTDYRDFNLIYLPVLHLLLQTAPDADPASVPVARSENGLLEGFSRLVSELRDPKLASAVATRVAPFITKLNYPAYLRPVAEALVQESHSNNNNNNNNNNNDNNNVQHDGQPHFLHEDFGFAQFRAWILGSFGLCAGFDPEFADVVLLWEDHVLRIA